MSKETFILIAIAYYILSIIVIVVFLILYNKKVEKNYKLQIDLLEREKNLIISTSILSELNKLKALAKNDDLKEKYSTWKKSFNSIKENDLDNIVELISDLDTLFLEHNYKELKPLMLNTELELNKVKTKTDSLLDDIKEITYSEEKNRETITRLKAEFRDIRNTYKADEVSFDIIKEPLELQFENADKLLIAFEKLMDNNEYTEVSKVVKAVDDIVKNLNAVIDESKPILSLTKNLIPKKIEEVMYYESKMEKDGYNLNYLNIDYNKDEAEKKIVDVLDRIKILNIEDSLFELKTIYDYFDSLLSDFDKEKVARKIYEELVRSVILKATKLEKVNNELLKKIDDIKYSYDLSDEEASIVFIIRDEILRIRNMYDKIVEEKRSNKSPYSKLTKNMEDLKVALVNTEDKLNLALRTLGSLKEDEIRAREQLMEIKQILHKTKEMVSAYNLPMVPKNYYVELAEAMQAIQIMHDELDKRPISIKTLNTRVDTARDLTLKVHSTINETIKTAKMAEITIVYGNRYRVISKDVDFGLTKAENAFNKGNFKNSLENAINAINLIEPGIYKKLLQGSEK